MAKRWKRTVVLGIDGLDPALVEEYMAAGIMPSFARLARSGTVDRLRPSLPPMSPVAWSDMATGADAGCHGIFDFLHRRTEDYAPYLSIRNSSAGLLGAVYRPARRCDGFWRFTSDAGVPTTVIRWPVTFPPDKVSGRMLSGLGTPDLLGREGRDTLYASHPPMSTKPELGPDHVVPLRWNGTEAQTKIEGPAVSRSACATLALHIRSSEPDTVELHIQGAGSVRARKGEWTPYVRVQFKAGLRRVRAITRFLLVESGPQLRLYLAPLQLDPQNPVYPMSWPRRFSGDLADEQGLFSTLGMAESIHPVTKGWFGYDALLALCDGIDAERVKMLEAELARFEEGLLAFVFDTSDRVQHGFWFTRDPDHPARSSDNARRYAHVLPELYRRMDAAVGTVLEAADGETAVWVVSDHGIGTFRRAVHVNRWLIQNGYLHLRGADGEEAGVLFDRVDWSRTRAYALGFTSIYLNVKGREAEGIVQPGDEQRRLCAEIAARLKELKDPSNGAAVVRGVYPSAEAYSGPMTPAAPDLILGTNLGYRASWQTALGGAPTSLIEDNTDAWTGDHLFDPAVVPGVIASNQRLGDISPRGVDVAPTVLACTGAARPPHVTGRSLVG